MKKMIHRFSNMWGLTFCACMGMVFLCLVLPQQVLSASKTISVNPARLVNSCPKGHDASLQSFEVWNSSGGAIAYTISLNADWLSVIPASGTSSGEHDPIRVNYSTADLGVGNYNAIITVTAPAASNSPVQIPVRLNVGATQPWFLLLLD